MRYKVNFEVVLDDSDPSDPDWLRAVIETTLDYPKEHIENFVVEQVV